jgi:hypothetical protein
MSRITQAIHHHPTAAYFVMVYSSAWAVWITVGILTNEIPLGAVLVGAWTPSVSAVILTGYLTGRSSMRLLLRRILLWRVGIRWYLFVLFSAAIIGLTAWDIYCSQSFFLTNIFIGGPLGVSIWHSIHFILCLFLPSCLE